MERDLWSRAKDTFVMPYRSKAQARWAHTSAGKKALGGAANVREWDRETKGKKLPERVGRKKKSK